MLGDTKNEEWKTKPERKKMQKQKNVAMLLETIKGKQTRALNGFSICPFQSERKVVTIMIHVISSPTFHCQTSREGG